MTLDEFIERYNQEITWDSEILDDSFFNTHPFLKDEIHGYLSNDTITPEKYDYGTTMIYEEKNEHSQRGRCFECQMYCNESYSEHYLYIHPDLDEEAYKKWKRSVVNKWLDSHTEELMAKKNDIEAKLGEIEELRTALNIKKN